GLQGERDVVGKKEFRPGTEGIPLRRTMVRHTVARPLIDEERHDSELLIRLDQKVFLNEQSLLVLEKRSWVVQGSAEVTCRALAIANRKFIEASVEFCAGMAKPETPAVRRGNHATVLLSATLCKCIVEPHGGSSCRCFHVVEPHIDVAFG